MGAFAPARLLCLVKLGGLIKERIVAKLMSALCIRRGRFAYLSFGYAKTSSVDNVNCPRFFCVVVMAVASFLFAVLR